MTTLPWAILIVAGAIALGVSCRALLDMLKRRRWERDVTRIAEEMRQSWDAYGEPKRSSAIAILLLREAAQKRDAKG